MELFVNNYYQDLFVIKGRRPLTHHICNITIITKTYTNCKDEQDYDASYKTTQNINRV